MRELKFRAWDKHDKRMIYEKDVDSTTKTFPSLLAVGFHGLPISIDDTSVRENEIVGFNVDHVYDLMQYTGLKDKNGKEIYEGDIYHKGDKNIKYLVVWHDTGLIGKQVGSSSYAGLQHWQSKIEIVGNICESPELIEKDSK